jgi:hypothetical protein
LGPLLGKSESADKRRQGGENIYWEQVFRTKSFYEKADRCQGTFLGLLFVP